jgi:acyl dehydratase
MDEHREMKVTPDRYVTYRYAGASGDFNPIHLDDEFARSVGLPGRILHGLWTMAQVARAQGDGLKLQSLSVQFRGVGVPEQEITITSKGTNPAEVEAVQGDNKLVRRGRATFRS